MKFAVVILQKFGFGQSEEPDLFEQRLKSMTAPVRRSRLRHAAARPALFLRSA